jgi:hypothetical protein
VGSIGNQGGGLNDGGSLNDALNSGGVGRRGSDGGDGGVGGGGVAVRVGGGVQESGVSLGLSLSAGSSN